MYTFYTQVSILNHWQEKHNETFKHLLRQKHEIPDKGRLVNEPWMSKKPEFH